MAPIPEESVTQSKVVGALGDDGEGGARSERATLPPNQDEVQALPTADVGSSEESEVLAPDTVNVVTRSQTRRVTESTTAPGTVCRASGSPVRERGALPAILRARGTRSQPSYLPS